MMLELSLCFKSHSSKQHSWESQIIEEIVHAFPPVIWSSDEENRNVFQLAVMNRMENVFSLRYQMTNYKQLVTRLPVAKAGLA